MLKFNNSDTYRVFIIEKVNLRGKYLTETLLLMSSFKNNIVHS